MAEKRYIHIGGSPSDADQIKDAEKVLRHAKFSIPKQHSKRHRPQDSTSMNPFASFVANAKLDTSQVEDRRDETKHNPRLYRFWLAHGMNKGFSPRNDASLERPSPKPDNRWLAAGTHHNHQIIPLRNAMGGDGRVERPAPKNRFRTGSPGPHFEDQPSPAGTAPRKSVKKPKPRAAMPTPTPKLHRFNNGRDA